MFRPLVDWSLTAAATAIRQGIIESLGGGGSADGYVCHHFWVEGSIYVVFEGIVCAAPAFGFQLDPVMQLPLGCSQVSSSQGKAINSLLVGHGLCTQGITDVTQLTVEILVYLQQLLIVVGVALDTMKQIESGMLMRNYEGFMK